jgi:2-oxoglutarate dehydrogenase E2 component (dihydrolipoamide succinyltransferase)
MANLGEQKKSGLVDVIIESSQIEGTAARFSQWLVEPGTAVKAGDPLLELETDKVTMEVPAPADGILVETMALQGQEITPEFVLGRIQTDSLGSALAAGQLTSSAERNPDPASTQVAPQQDSSHTSGRTKTAKRSLIGPAVRRLTREHNLDLENLSGSGRGGRVTRDDVLSFLELQSQPSAAPEANISARTQLRSRNVPHTSMRKAIARHMVDSLLVTSPHVTSVFEMNMSNVIEHRRWHKKEYAEQGINLTFTAYFLAASVAAIREVPEVNARYHDDHLEIIEDVNIGVGTALGNKGLIVPVIPLVQDLSLFKIAEALQAQTEKARSCKLVPTDMRNGTFSISNHGTSGSLFAAPIIINQPQVAILGVGKLEKRVVVETINGEDKLTIKPMCYVSLSIDHRALDAYQTNLFLSHFVRTMEEWGQ